MSLMRAALIVLLAAGAVSTAPAAEAGSWPQFRGPNRDGICPETGLLESWPEGGPPLAWKMTGLGKGLSSLSIVGGKIFTTGDRGDEQFVTAFDLAGHKELWATKLGGAWKDPASPGARCTPTVDGDLVYATGTYGDLVCVQAKDGKEVWRKNFGTDFGGKMMTMWAFSESPLVDGDKLVCTPGGSEATIVALDKKTGDTVWKCAVPALGPRGKDGAAYSSIVISEACGVRQYVQLLGRGVAGVEAKTGKFLWGYNKVANNVANIPNPVISGDYVFATTSYETGCCLLKLTKTDDGVKAEEVYFRPYTDFSNHHGGVVLIDAYLYGGDGRNNGSPTCLEMKTGKVMWKKPGLSKGSAAVLYADKHLYFRYERGAGKDDAPVIALIEANPNEFKVKGTFKLPAGSGPNWPHPVILDGMLYLRYNDTLLCYDVRSGK